MFVSLIEHRGSMIEDQKAKVKSRKSKTQYMKHAFLHYALPLAFVAALPLLDAMDASHPHPHGQGLAMHQAPPPALTPWESVKMDGFREEKMNDMPARTVHFDAARAELKMTTMHMAREAVVNAGVNDEDMDLAFNLEFGLADLSTNSAGSDADISTDFSLDNELADLSADNSGADADIDNAFSLENKLADLGSSTALADAEINAQFATGK